MRFRPGDYLICDNTIIKVINIVNRRLGPHYIYKIVEHPEVAGTIQSSSTYWVELNFRHLTIEEKIELL